MSTAILCGGPSLTAHWSDSFKGSYAEVIGVNTAGLAYSVDWLAFMDWHIIRAVTSGRARPPSVGCLCKQGMRLPNKRWEDISNTFRTLGRAPAELQSQSALPVLCGYTFANTLAWVQKRTSYGIVHIYGFDCAPGPVDFSGQPGDHSAERWRKELLWLREAWGPNIEVRSDLPNETLDWLCAGPPAHQGKA